MNDERPRPTSLSAAPVAAPGATLSARTRFRQRGIVIGIEAGVGTPSGTSATVYRGGLGSGLVLGYRHERLSLEWHFLQSYALSAKDPPLRGETTLGTLGASSALVGFRLLDAPVIVSVMAGPAMLSAPILVVTTETSGAHLGDQLIEARSMDGVGLIAGVGAGVAITRRIELTADVRKVVATSWELPALDYVVPAGTSPDGGVMYTTATEDATGSAWTATLVVRFLL